MAKEVTFSIKIKDDGSTKQVTADAEELGRVIRSVQDEADKLKSKVVTWAQAAQAAETLNNAVSQLQSIMSDLTAAYQTQMVAETQLNTIMRQRMNSTDEEIQSVKNLCAAQQQLGVIGDEVQLSGAQQMATFLQEKQSLDTLIPAMNNLLAQQNGLNATNQDAVSIGNMMGKAMQGQVDVLQRVGITFDENQKKVLQYGNESERAAMLAEVITANVGNMNEELANTDAGKQKQLENTLGDIKEQLGSMVQGAMPFVTIAAQATLCITGCLQLVAAMRSLNAAFAVNALKSAALAVHHKMLAMAQRMLAASSMTATAGTTALTVAVTALYAAATMGLSLIITGLVALFSSLGDEAEDASEDVDMLKESTDALNNASSNAKAELDMEIQSLASLINSSKNTAKKVDELNKKYGESFGYHRTAAEWYDTLIEKSKVYCEQMGYEAQARVLAAQIAAKQLEKESKQAEQFQLGQQYWDGEGKIHYNYENAAGGKDYYDQLGAQIGQLNKDIDVLQRQYDSAIKHMVDAQKQLDASRQSVRVSGDNLKEATTEELKQTVEGYQKELDGLTGEQTAERQRLNREIARLNQELKARKAINDREQGNTTSGGKNGHTTTTPKNNVPDKPVANATTLEDYAKNISYYENELKKTNTADKEKIESLTQLINKYKELQEKVKQLQEQANRPASLGTLEDYDAEIQFQMQLRKRASKDELAQIDATIKALQKERTAFEDSSHVKLDIKKGEIKTYEQLDSEIAFYERKLRGATDTERAEIKKQINELQKLRTEWDDMLSTLERPGDINALNSLEELDKALSYYSDRQRKASGEEVENIQRTINALQQKRDALSRMTELPSMQQETADLSGLSGKSLRLELEVIGIDGIRDKIRSLQKMLNDTKNPLGDNQREEVKKLVSEWTRYEKVLRKSQADFRDAWGSVKNIGGGVQSLTEALDGNKDAWTVVTGVVDSFIQIYDGVNSIIGIVQALTGVTTTQTAATEAQGVAKATEATINTTATAAEVANSAARATASGVETTADVAGAAAKTMKAHAGIPWVGIAIGAGMVASLVGLMASLPKFADGGIAYGPTLGIFGEYAGASHNPEVVAPLNKLKSLIGDAGGGGGVGRVIGRLKGRDIELVLANETRLNHKRSNIR